MWVLQNLKTDWTADDYYNHDDLNRVEMNMWELRDAINQRNGVNISMTFNTGRTRSSIEFPTSLIRIEVNQNILYGYLPYFSNFIPSKIDWDYGDQKFDFNDANRLEKNVFTMYLFVAGNKDNTGRYCGKVIAGEKGVY